VAPYPGVVARRLGALLRPGADLPAVHIQRHHRRAEHLRRQRLPRHRRAAPHADYGRYCNGYCQLAREQADLAGALANAIIHGKTVIDLPGSNNNWEVDDATRKPKFIFSGYGVPLLKQIEEIHTAVKAAAGQSTVTLSDADRAAITQALVAAVPVRDRAGPQIATAVLDEQHRRDAA
jgi:hypothetical protein